MAIITEDYVSFETAKLLKEKGFKGYCSKVIAIEDIIETRFEGRACAREELISCPTLQMAMKWLREVHDLYIEVSPSCDREDKNAKIFDASLFNLQNQRYKKLSNIQGYEEACEAAIKYYLNNFILK